MSLKYLSKDVSDVLEYLFKNIKMKKAEDLVKWLKLTSELCTDSYDLSVSVGDNGSVAFCKNDRPLAIWH